MKLTSYTSLSLQSVLLLSGITSKMCAFLFSPCMLHVHLSVAKSNDTNKSPQQTEYTYYSSHINFGITWQIQILWWYLVLPSCFWMPLIVSNQLPFSLNFNLGNGKSLMEPGWRNMRGDWALQSLFWSEMSLHWSLYEPTCCHAKATNQNVPSLW